MITLDEAEHILDRLSQRSVTTDPSHCVRVRNRNASCHTCQEACPVDAITIKDNQLLLDDNACTQCGACANVCPTQAISSAAIPHSIWAHYARSLMDFSENQRCAWICCESHPLAKEELKHLMVVPCLAHLDEVHYLLLAYYGISIQLIHAHCEECPKGHARHVIELTMKRTHAIADLWNIALTLTMTEERSALDSIYPRQHDKGGYSRRRFLSSVGESLKEISLSIADSSLNSTATEKNQTSTLAEQLTKAPGELKTFFPARVTALLNILYDAHLKRIRSNAGQQMSNDDGAHRAPDRNDPLPRMMKSRFWGEVSIDDTCRNCGICARFCPTQALVHKGPEAPTAASSLLGTRTSKGPDHEFSCADCIQCHLCEDVCRAQALHVHDEIVLARLFCLEPRTIKRHDEYDDPAFSQGAHHE